MAYETGTNPHCFFVQIQRDVPLELAITVDAEEQLPTQKST